MANRQRAEARRKAQAKAAHGGGGVGNMWMWIAIGLVVVLGGGIAFFVTRDDTKDATPDSSTTTQPSGPTLPDSQPVGVTGDALPAYDAAESPDSGLGLDAPVLAGLDFQGDAIAVDPADGPYMIVFLAHWCPHCNVEVPRLLDWKNSGAVPADLNVIGVATAVSANADFYPPSSWFSSKGWSWPVLVDQSTGDGTAGVAATAFGATGWPYFVIVGSDGKVKARVSGEVEIAELQTIVDDALAS